MSGLEAFRPVFGALVIAAAGVVLGLFVFILPGIWLFVRWAFVPQAVVLDGRRGVAALQRSAELVTGSWWRGFGPPRFTGHARGGAPSPLLVPRGCSAEAAPHPADPVRG